MKIQKAASVVVLLFLLVGLAGCSSTKIDDLSNTPQQTLQEMADYLPETDRSGNPITLPDQVDRIISMAPSATQTLLDLGLEDKLIAVDTYSAMYFGLEDLPTFDMMDPDTEQMAILEADLIFTTGMSASSGADPFKPCGILGPVL